MFSVKNKLMWTGIFNGIITINVIFSALSCRLSQPCQDYHRECTNRKQDVAISCGFPSFNCSIIAFLKFQNSRGLYYMYFWYVGFIFNVYVRACEIVSTKTIRWAVCNWKKVHQGVKNAAKKRAIHFEASVIY